MEGIRIEANFEAMCGNVSMKILLIYLLLNKIMSEIKINARPREKLPHEYHNDSTVPFYSFFKGSTTSSCDTSPLALCEQYLNVIF